MNLYDASQTNNDEFGILISKAQFPTTYKNVFTEVERLSRSYDGKNISSPNNALNEKKVQFSKSANQLERKKKYSQEELKSYFKYDGKLYGGINLINSNTVILIWRANSKYTNRYQNGIVYYMGQNTGSGDQKLIYGNKVLYDAFTDRTIHIHLLKDDIYCGEYYVCEQPYLEAGRWIFPLKNCNNL